MAENLLLNKSIVKIIYLTLIRLVKPHTLMINI